MKNKRCSWCAGNSLYEDYHDREWGVPLKDDRKLFEFLVLESFQAGLSWLTILRKRQAFREAFDQFYMERVARYGAEKKSELLQNKAIVRNRLKIDAAINNAQCVLKIQNEYQSFSQFLWSYVDHRPVQNCPATEAEVPSKTHLSQKLSKDLKKHGFKFFGPTTAYAFMQATGMVNDHVEACFRSKEIAQLG